MVRWTVAFCVLPLWACGEVTEAPVEGTWSSAGRLLEGACVGSPYPTIQAALDAAVDGDIVEVCSGTFHERLQVVGKSITLRSRSGAAVTSVDGDGWAAALAVSGGADVVVSGLTFLGGATLGDGGNIVCAASTLELVDSVSSGGVASGSGGGLAAVDCVGAVTRTRFEGNVAGWNGGGMWVTGGAFSVVDATFTDNSSGNAGGGLFAIGDLDASGTTFVRNDAVLYGGGAYLQENSGDLAANTFTENTSGDDGGGLYLLGGLATVSGTRFERNDSSDEGGGMRMKLSGAILTGNTFVANHADYRGGGLKVSHWDTELHDNTFTDNSAWSAAGALFLEESASLVSGGTFTGNTAEDGGALQVMDGWDAVVVADVRFTNNRATRNGGAIHLDLPGSPVTLVRVDLTAGRAQRGAGLYAFDTEVRLSNVLLRTNVATVSGGALYAAASPVTWVNSVAWHNEAPAGAAASFEASSGALFNSAFVGNVGGAALHIVSGATPSVWSSDFSGNTAIASGASRPVRMDGNTRAQPGFTNASAGDFTLLAGSALIDSGDVTVLDLDGSRSDIGLYGGPNAL